MLNMKYFRSSIQKV